MITVFFVDAYRCSIVHHRSVVVWNAHVDVDQSLVEFQKVVPETRIDVRHVQRHVVVAVRAHVLVPEANRVADFMDGKPELHGETHIVIG